MKDTLTHLKNEQWNEDEKIFNLLKEVGMQNLIYFTTGELNLV